MPSSSVRREIAQILRKEGFIEDFQVVKQGPFEKLRIKLKYGPDKKRAITGIKRVSKPGLRVYVKRENVPRVLGGIGIAIISTSKGILTDSEARKLGVGGEVICYVW
jgi:small subunit ribosomal protein S8